MCACKLPRCGLFLLRQREHVQVYVRRQPPDQREQGRDDAIFSAAIHPTGNDQSNFHRARNVMNAEDVTVIRPCHEDDVPGLVALFARVFGKTITAEHWHWKLRSLTSQAPNVLLATSNDQPVFQYAGIPTALSLNGARIDAMVAVDGMTAPDFRRRGLLTRVVTEAHARWRETGIDLVLGLPNEQWGSRTAALGWLPMFDLQRLIRPLRPEAMLAQRLGMPWLRRLRLASTLWNGIIARLPHRHADVQTEMVGQADGRFDRLWEKCRANAKFAVVRNRAWVQWRFLDCPSRRYRVLLATRDGEPAGYCAYSVYESEGRRRALLAELAAPQDDDAARRTLLADLLHDLLAEGVEHVSTLAVPGTPDYRELRASGFFRSHAFLVHMVPLAASLPVEEMRRAANWDLSGAAFDVI
jgi:GNAT superfamily N-acetyltransferase